MRTARKGVIELLHLGEKPVKVDREANVDYFGGQVDGYDEREGIRRNRKRARAVDDDGIADLGDA